MIEAYTVSRDRQNFHAAISSSYNKEVILQARKKEIEKNILGYIGEYRLGVKFAEFYYREEVSESGERYLAASEPGAIRNIYRRAIDEKKRKGLSSRREEAEYEGFSRFERALINAPDRMLFLWISPPGSREDGYGDYSFTFIGQSEIIGNEKRIRVIPYRNTLSNAEHSRYYSLIDAKGKSFERDTDFLANPAVFEPIKGVLDKPEDILHLIGEQEEVNTEWVPKLKKIIGPLIYAYLHLVERGASDEELQKAKFAIENVSLAFKGEILAERTPTIASRALLAKTTGDIFEEWGNRIPPRALGSCGSSQGLTGSPFSTLFQFQFTFNIEESTGFLCPNCKNAWVKGNQCPGCKITAAEWQKQHPELACK